MGRVSISLRLGERFLCGLDAACSGQRLDVVDANVVRAAICSAGEFVHCVPKTLGSDVQVSIAQCCHAADGGGTRPGDAGTSEHCR